MTQTFGLHTLVRSESAQNVFLPKLVCCLFTI